MAIKFRLSSRVQKDTQKREILIRFYVGRKIDLFAKSEIYINPDYFKFDVDRAKCEAHGIHVPSNINALTLKRAEKLGYFIKEYGEMAEPSTVKRIETDEVKRHKELKDRLDNLVSHINKAYEDADKEAIGKDWLQSIVDEVNHPNRPIKFKDGKFSIVDLTEYYIANKEMCYVNQKTMRVIARDILRYEGFKRLCENKRYVFDVNTITADDIIDFKNYLINEKSLSDEYPEIFAKLLKSYPAGVLKGSNEISERGRNTIVKLMRNLGTFLTWLRKGTDKKGNKVHLIKNNPFGDIDFKEQIGKEEYGEPYYIERGERNTIADFDFSDCKRLETQRDIFIFQCLVGCRVGDLMKLTIKNISRNEKGRYILSYVPHKTEKNTGVQATVPLNAEAVALVHKYHGVDAKGRLFPFISPQKYNDAIKEILTKAGITRYVLVKNPKTGETEQRRINEIASSHLARRTFVGNAYQMGSDPILIGKMSGHVEGSKAFQRYHDVKILQLERITDKL